MEGFPEVLSSYVPPGAVDYCVGLKRSYPFVFKLRKRRVSKLGDYRYYPQTDTHVITVNADLNPYAFLITYIHEVAHRIVHRPGSFQKPHGQQWKLQFKQLMLPLLKPEIFPASVLSVLVGHMKNPKASASADQQLVKVLAQFDERKEGQLHLSDISIGTVFSIKNRVFKKLEVKRTRAVCMEVQTNRKYLVPLMAEVKVT